MTLQPGDIVVIRSENKDRMWFTDDILRVRDRHSEFLNAYWLRDLSGREVYHSAFDVEYLRKVRI